MRTYRHQPVRSSKCLNRNKIREPTGNAVKAGAGAADCEHLLMAALFSFYSFVQQSASGAVTNPPPEELRETGGPNDEVGPSPFSLLTHPSILSVRLSVRHVCSVVGSPSCPVTRQPLGSPERAHPSAAVPTSTLQRSSLL